MSTGLEAAGWSSRRVWVFSAVVLVVQVGLIYWLSDRKPPVERPPSPSPTLQLAGETSRELFALQNPAIFALPRKESFAGLAWMTPWTPANREVEWKEIPIWLPLETAALGGVFNKLALTNVVRLWHAPSLPEPVLLTPVVEPHQAVPQRSMLVVISEGTTPGVNGISELPSWPPRAISPTDFEILTNSVVSAMYGPDGRVISASLLSGSGSSAADDYALSATRGARFEAPPGTTNATNSPVHNLNWARLIFEWHTLPGTNAPAAAKS